MEPQVYHHHPSASRHRRPSAAIRTRMLSGDPITNIESLPDELLFDILVCLAADYLSDRARLVCRKWWRIIQYSDAFTTTHIQKYSTSGLVLSLQYSASPPRSIYVTATQDGRIETSEFNHIFTTRTSANGLVVQFKTVAQQLHVINPATKQSFLLPSVSDVPYSRFYHSRCGIAYSSASMKYKVTLPSSITIRDRLLAFLDIVTVGVDKSWRHDKLPRTAYFYKILFDESPLSSEGFLHWGSGRDCLTLNVETEILTRTEVPIPPYWYDYYYLSTGRYLTLLVGGCKELWWDVWEMRPAESGEWRKAVVPNIDLEPHKSKLLAIESDNPHPHLSPLGWVKYPEVLAFCVWGTTRKKCVFYNLETREISAINLPDQLKRAIVHRNSLVWLS